MDRSIFVWSKSTNSCYCGKCGKRQPGDRYNIRKHAVACGFDVKEEDDVLLVKEDSDWMYSLECSFDDGRSGDRRPGDEKISNKLSNGNPESKLSNGTTGSKPNGNQPSGMQPKATLPRATQPNVLILRICAPHLITIRGFKDRFSGVEWTPIFTAEFHAGSKTPNIVKNETGYEMDTLLSLIRAGRIVSIRKGRDVEVIRRVFPCIDIYSLQMFVHIYKNKGFNFESRLSRATERWLYGNIQGTKKWKKFEPKGVKNGANGGQSGENAGIPLGKHAKTPLIAMMYRQTVYKYILQVVVVKGKKPPVFLFTKGYCSCNQEVDLKELLGQDYYLVGESAAMLQKFSKIYPEYHLAEYMERSENVLVPLLAGEYHAGMELAAKAGAVGVVECFGELGVFDNSPALYRNLKDMFGLPASVLRALERGQVSEEALARLRVIYEYSPAFLQFERYTESMMEFYMRADITHAAADAAGGTAGQEGAARGNTAGRAGAARAARWNAAIGAAGQEGAVRGNAAAGAAAGAVARRGNAAGQEGAARAARGNAAIGAAGQAGAARGNAAIGAAGAARGNTAAVVPRGLAIRDVPQDEGTSGLLRYLAANAMASGYFRRARMMEIALRSVEHAELAGDAAELDRVYEAAGRLIREAMVEEIRKARGVEGIDALSDKQILQILRYLEKHPDEGHYYCDYMNACAQLGEYLYGLTPDIPIREAHDRVVVRVLNKYDVKTQKTFEEVVSAEAYQRLTTCASEADAAYFKKDAYMVIAPEHSDDLFTESQNMHNCVRIYVPQVTKRSTRIYFLRRKKEPEKCLGTLEVSASGGQLLQAKAFANRRLEEKEQEFIVKWCKYKGIAIQTRDIEERDACGEKQVLRMEGQRLRAALGRLEDLDLWELPV